MIFRSFLSLSVCSATFFLGKCTNFGSEKLKSHREKATESAINVLHDLITNYFDSDQLLCPHHNENQRFACDALVLGAFFKGCISIRIWPKSTAPYPGWIFKNLVSQIRGLKLLEHLHRRNRETHPYSLLMNAMETEPLSKSRWKLWKMVCVGSILITSCPRRQCSDGTVLVRFGG